MAWWRGIAIAVAAAFWLGAAPAMAGPDEDVAALIDQTNALRDAGKDAEALALAEKAVALAEQAFGPDSEKLARPLRSLGVIHLRAAASGGGDWAKAESLLKRSLTAREKNPSGVKPDLGEALMVLAMAYSMQKKLDESDGYFDRYVDHAEARIAAGKLRPDDPDLAKALIVQWGRLSHQGPHCGVATALSAHDRPIGAVTWGTTILTPAFWFSSSRLSLTCCKAHSGAPSRCCRSMSAMLPSPRKRSQTPAPILALQ